MVEKGQQQQAACEGCASLWDSSWAVDMWHGTATVAWGNGCGSALHVYEAEPCSGTRDIMAKL